MRRERGQTLIEVTIVVAVLAILAVIAVPTYRRTAEQARVDTCAAALRTVWSAQRAHWLETRSYAEDFDTLAHEGFLDSAALPGASWFEFDMSSVSSTTFVATATRRSDGAWAGSIAVDQSGNVTGTVTNEEDDVVAPGAK